MSIPKNLQGETTLRELIVYLKKNHLWSKLVNPETITEPVIKAIKEEKTTKEIAKMIDSNEKGAKELIKVVKNTEEKTNKELKAMTKATKEGSSKIAESIYSLKEAKMQLQLPDGVIVKGKDGEKGEAGKDGVYTLKEQKRLLKLATPIKDYDYRDGKDGSNGLDGSDGIDGLDGIDGDKGDMPKHKWKGTKLKFEKPDGKWGKYVDLRGKSGKEGSRLARWLGSNTFLELSDAPTSYAGQAGNVPVVNAGETGLEWGSGGSGDVVGPGSAVDENITVFDSTTGKLIKDSGINISAVTANTAKVTNATHTGDVTGSTELTIGADKVHDSMIDWGTGAGQVSAVDLPIADSGGYFTGSETEAVTQEIGQELLVHNLNGFEDASTVALSSNGGTPPTYTLTFTGTVYWWSDGVRYSDSGTDAIQIDDTSGMHIIYYDGATLSKVVNPSHAQIDNIICNKAIAMIVYWNTNDNSESVIASELHGIQMSGATHHWAHDNIGSIYNSGGVLSAYTLQTATDVAISFDITNIEFYDEDIKFEAEDGVATNQYEQVLTGDAEIPVLYRDAVDQSWTEQAASTLPYLIGGTPRIQYMDKDDSYALKEVPNNDFCSYWLIATNDWQYPIKMVPGDQYYTTRNDAIENSPEEVLGLGDLPAAEFVILYQFIMKDTSGGTTNATIDFIVDFRNSGKAGSSANPATDHGNLVGLADDDHTQYALLAGRSGGQTLIGGTDSGDDLTLQSTSHATKGKIYLGSNSYYDEENELLRIGYSGAVYSDMLTDSAGDLFIRNTGQQIGIGRNTLLNSTGSKGVAIGQYAMEYNTGNTVFGIGIQASKYNTGISSMGIGYYALRRNIGGKVIGLGSYALQYNEGLQSSAIGWKAFSIFNQDTANEKTWTTALSGNQITVTGHGFGSAGVYRNLEVTTTGVLPTGLSADIHQWKIIDADTLECRDDTFTAGTGSGTHKVIPQFIYENAHAIGSEAEPDASNQVMLGDTNVTEVKTSGNIVSGGFFSGIERSSDPTEPAEGEYIIWMSNGTGKGDDGDVLIASQAGGTTNWGTLFDHSAGTAW